MLFLLSSFAISLYSFSMVSASKTFIANMAFAVLVSAREAPYNRDSSKRAVARAHLDDGLVKGIIEFTTKDKIVNVHLDTTGLPPNAGPFFYHINSEKCGSSDEVLNPYDSIYGECDELDNNSECAVGDLSGKHGFIDTTCYEVQYQDPYLSLNKKNVAFVGGKSVVIIDRHQNKIACGDIHMARKAKLSREEYNSYSEEVEEEEEDFEAVEEPLIYEEAEVIVEGSLIYDETSEMEQQLLENGTFGNASWGGIETEYDSGSNSLLTSGLIGVLAGGLALLI